MNLVLIGYRGTGKTTVAQRLADRLHWPWWDADTEIETAAGKPIAAIFADDGESAFRDWEAAVLQQLTQGDRQVLALGGGAILREENRRLIQRAGFVVWLCAQPPTIARRVAEDPHSATQRPNLTASGGLQEIVDVLASREALYRECADIKVDTEDKDADAVADEILSQFQLNPDAS